MLEEAISFEQKDILYLNICFIFYVQVSYKGTWQSQVNGWWKAGKPYFSEVNLVPCHRTYVFQVFLGPKEQLVKSE